MTTYIFPAEMANLYNADKTRKIFVRHNRANVDESIPELVEMAKEAGGEREKAETEPLTAPKRKAAAKTKPLKDGK